MYRDLRYGPKRYFFQKVAECPVYQGRQVVRLAWDTKVENADMSNDKECAKHSRRKSKGSDVKLNYEGLDGP